MTMKILILIDYAPYGTEKTHLNKMVIAMGTMMGVMMVVMLVILAGH